MAYLDDELFEYCASKVEPWNVLLAKELGVFTSTAPVTIPEYNNLRDLMREIQQVLIDKTNHNWMRYLNLETGAVFDADEVRPLVQRSVRLFRLFRSRVDNSLLPESMKNLIRDYCNYEKQSESTELWKLLFKGQPAVPYSVQVKPKSKKKGKRK